MKLIKSFLWSFLLETHWISHAYFQMRYFKLVDQLSETKNEKRKTILQTKIDYVENQLFRLENGK